MGRATVKTDSSPVEASVDLRELSPNGKAISPTWPAGTVPPASTARRSSRCLDCVRAGTARLGDARPRTSSFRTSNNQPPFVAAGDVVARKRHGRSVVVSQAWASTSRRLSRTSGELHLELPISEGQLVEFRAHVQGRNLAPYPQRGALH